ncbi:MAG: hypothetical protein PHW10_02475 [Candidatus Peribacteraceae bacterium]|nr:hypothetical protein [Candidatus Peribacteraceae bacterium]
MFPNHRHPLLRARPFLLLGGALALMLWAGWSRLNAFVLQPVAYDRWSVIEPDEVEHGATVPASTHVIFQLPVGMPDMYRETLLGNRGRNTRYWGYCFPDDYDPDDPPQSFGFPGRMFLSEAERDVRELQRRNNVPRYSVYRPPTRSELQRDQEENDTNGAIRHQIEIFRGGMTCFIMTEAPLPIGTDRDDDGLNTQLEKQFGTDEDLADSDMDGLDDGTEVFNVHTDPLSADSDGDGVPDGIEVHGHTRLQTGDTDPLSADSDHDGLCDGYCLVDRNRRFCTADALPRCVQYDCTPGDTACVSIANRWAGEDTNLNGEVDDGETDPLKQVSFDDGIEDMARYYQCLLSGGTDC